MKEKIKSILSAMKVGTFEREEVLALSLLSALSGESIFLLGLPGVGKSMVARRLKQAFHNATVFEYLMSRFSTPDEIFGPVSISKLKDGDSYERVTTGYLPEAEIVFLDEIWKAGPAIQNSLLTVLNEKIFLNGNKELRLPIKGIISASNELPAEGEGLEALWDRFLIRYIVEPLKQRSSFERLVDTQEAQINNSQVIEPIKPDEYTGISGESQKITIPSAIMETLYSIRERMVEKASADKDEADENVIEPIKFYISDRRWRKAVGVLKVSAYLNGRKELSLSDVLLLSHMLWNDESTIEIVKHIVVEQIVKTLLSSLLEQFKSYKRHATREATDKRLYIADGKYYVVLCDGGGLKIAIKDYKAMKGSNQIFFGSEMSDGTIAVRQRGSFTMQVVKEGFININNYNYPLRTNADQQLSESFLSEVSDKLESLAMGLDNEIRNNTFVAYSDLRQCVSYHISIYRKRIEEG